MAVFACECGFRGFAAELDNEKCPRCGKSVKETSSPELRYKAWDKQQQDAEKARKEAEKEAEKASKTEAKSSGVGEGA